MTINPFQHVDIRVTDLEQARAFYGAFLPALGFVRDDSGERWQGLEICFTAL